MLLLLDEIAWVHLIDLDTPKQVAVDMTVADTTVDMIVEAEVRW